MTWAERPFLWFHWKSTAGPPPSSDVSESSLLLGKIIYSYQCINLQVKFQQRVGRLFIWMTSGYNPQAIIVSIVTKRGSSNPALRISPTRRQARLRYSLEVRSPVRCTRARVTLAHLMRKRSRIAACQGAHCPVGFLSESHQLCSIIRV